eukprot:5609298-Prymnesium_polylepis.1
MTEGVAADAMAEFNAHVERGVRSDAEALSTMLASSEREMHAEMLRREADANAAIRELNERCAAKFDGHHWYRDLE